MLYVEQNGAFLPLTSDLVVGDQIIPIGNFALWSDAECAAVGVYKVDPPVPPAGQQLDSFTVQRVNGIVTAVGIFSQLPFDRMLVSMECQRRIYAVASQNCQMNMTAWVASGQASASEKAAFASALAWVKAMRDAYAQLVASQDETFSDDSHWPVCPADAAALAAVF